MDYVVFADYRWRSKVRTYVLCTVTDRGTQGHICDVIGRFDTKQAAMTTGRLLAGRMGRIAYTTDSTTYPW